MPNDNNKPMRPAVIALITVLAIGAAIAVFAFLN
jgi:hypothetical protein